MPMLDPDTGEPILDPISDLPVYPTRTPTPGIVANLPKEIGFAEVTLDNGLAFISGEIAGNPRYGILVYYLENPADPQLIESLRVPGLGGMSRVRAHGNFDLETEVAASLLLVAGGGRLSAISINDLSRADIVVSLFATDDAVHDAVAYVADSAAGLTIVRLQ